MSLLACPDPRCAHLNEPSALRCSECDRILGAALDHGYRYVRLPKHRLAQGNGRVREHRLIAERKIGRPLTSSDIVHHLNGDKTDNRPENLRVLTRSEHSRLHGMSA
jgi:hypothetical protein